MHDEDEYEYNYNDGGAGKGLSAVVVALLVVGFFLAWRYWPTPSPEIPRSQPSEVLKSEYITPDVQSTPHIQVLDHDVKG